FDRFAFQSVDTDTFMAHMDSTLLADYGDVLDRDRILEWIYQPGLPEGAPTPRSDAFDRIDAVRDEWLAGDTPAADIATSQWTYHEWKAFLDGMPASLSPEQLTELDETFGLTEATNNEIAFSWLMIAIRNGYADADARLESFLITVGRNKFVRPLYQAMVEADRREEAQRIFEAAKPGYHPLTVKVNGAVVYEET
ncbi:MAG: leukotriene A4 hydrolase C-terminal domain-containing protein, partial [Pseudomonadota bacterium]